MQLTSLAGARRADVEFRGLRWTRRLNGGQTLAAQVAPGAEAAPELRVGDRVVQLWDGPSLRFHGKVRAPLTRSPDGVQFQAADPLELMRRYLQADLARSATDAAQVWADVLAAENARGTTRLRAGAAAASVLRDRTYERGKLTREVIDQLAQVDDGFYYVVNAVDGALPYLAETVIRYPASGAEQPDVKLEFGAGTVGNLASYEVVEGEPVTAADAVGSGEGSSRLYGRYVDAAAVAQYDLVEAVEPQTTVIEQATLDAHARSLVRPAPPVSYTVRPLGRAAGQAGPDVPRLLADFDVGDLVRLTIRDPDVGVDVHDLRVRVTEATVAVADGHDGELLEALTVEVP